MSESNLQNQKPDEEISTEAAQNVPESGQDQQQDKPGTISRRALIAAGWTVPVVVGVSLAHPRRAFAQTGHSDAHDDVIHDDVHGDFHSDDPHEDQHDDANFPGLHLDSHGDTPHSDTHSDAHLDHFDG